MMIILSDMNGTCTNLHQYDNMEYNKMRSYYKIVSKIMILVQYVIRKILVQYVDAK